MENNSNDRSRIAESAMKGILSNDSLVKKLSDEYKYGNTMENLVASLSIKCADALIKALEKTETKEDKKLKRGALRINQD